MKIGIISSSSEEIDEKYKNTATEIAHYLAEDNNELLFGGCSNSMMGRCYQEFINNNCKVTAYTTEKYVSDLVNLPYAESVVCDSTFDVKKNMFNDSDVIVALPGGIGTVSEIYSYIEEVRSNDKKKFIEIYNQDGYYLPLIEQLKIMVMQNFLSSDVFDYFKVSHDINEFIDHMNKYKLEEGVRHER